VKIFFIDAEAATTVLKSNMIHPQAEPGNHGTRRRKRMLRKINALP
jgi:hypothetical protein